MGKYSDLFQIFTKLVNGRKKIYKKNDNEQRN